ncbi:MAG: HAD family hydrolase [Spirochaetota bacterium]
MATLVAEQLSLIRSLSAPLTPETPDLPSRFTPRLCAPLPRTPRAVLFDVYGTLLISGSGDVGAARREPSDTSPERQRPRATPSPGAPAGGPSPFAIAFARATGERIAPEIARDGERAYREEITASHERSIAAGVRHPEVDIVDVWSRVLSRIGRSASLSRPVDVTRLAIAWETLTNPVWPMPHAADAIRALREARLPLGIVSNAQFYTPLLFPALFGADLTALGFDARLVVFSFREGRAKPDHSLFDRPLASLRERAIDSESTLYVGNDMRNDVHCAASAGCMTALFASDRRSFRPRSGDPQLEDLLPDTVIVSLDQLPSLVREAQP